MSPSAVLTGRTVSDVVNNVLVLVVMSLTGLVVGWRIHTSVLEALAGYVLLLVFAYAISWVMAWIGMLVPSPEVVNNAAFIIIFPLTFVANTFVPLDTLPGPLQTFAEWNPVSAVTQAARNLFGNPNPNPQAPPPAGLGAAAPGALHPDLGGGRAAGLRAAGQLAVPPFGQPLTVPPERAPCAGYARRPPPRQGRRPSGVRCGWGAGQGTYGVALRTLTCRLLAVRGGVGRGSRRPSCR